MNQRDPVWNGVITDMAEGVLLLDLGGRITFLNPAAEQILGLEGKDLVFGRAFFHFQENDAFNQVILDAVYDPSSKHYGLVPYYTGAQTRQLRIMTSRLTDGGKPIGIIVMLGDVTELAQLKLQYAQQITVLLNSLVKALSTAIDERSHYNANHTRSMVRMAEAFLEWLSREKPVLRFEEDRQHAFLMSVWLHDVGKLGVPLAVMDKATRLGPALEAVEHRFEKIRLLNRIALLEGRITREEWRAREDARALWLGHIRRINAAMGLSEEDEGIIEEIARSRCPDEDGGALPFLTEDEAEALKIRRGTLTAGEREIMQSHVVKTARILAQVHFPEAFARVPQWAAMHHELLDGTGYPDHRRGDEIPMEVRLLTILDIYEALTARDRPYKKPMTHERAFAILRGMADAGSLDSGLLDLFEQSEAWKARLD